jgi:hypothetical protein
VFGKGLFRDCSVPRKPTSLRAESGSTRLSAFTDFRSSSCKIGKLGPRDANLKLQEIAVGSARRASGTTLVPEGPNHFEENRTDCRRDHLFHGSLLEMVQVQQDTELHRLENAPENSARPTDARLYPGPCRAQPTTTSILAQRTRPGDKRGIVNRRLASADLFLRGRHLRRMQAGFIRNQHRGTLVAVNVIALGADRRAGVVGWRSGAPAFSPASAAADRGLRCDGSRGVPAHARAAAARSSDRATGHPAMQTAATPTSSFWNFVKL